MHDLIGHILLSHTSFHGLASNCTTLTSLQRTVYKYFAFLLCTPSILCEQWIQQFNLWLLKHHFSIFLFFLFIVSWFFKCVSFLIKFILCFWFVYVPLRQGYMWFKLVSNSKYSWGKLWTPVPPDSAFGEFWSRQLWTTEPFSCFDYHSFASESRSVSSNVPFQIIEYEYLQRNILTSANIFRWHVNHSLNPLHLTILAAQRSIQDLLLNCHFNPINSVMSYKLP